MTGEQELVIAGAVWFPHGDPVKATKIKFSGPMLASRFFETAGQALRDVGDTGTDLFIDINGCWWDASDAKMRNQEWLPLAGEKHAGI